MPDWIIGESSLVRKNQKEIAQQSPTSYVPVANKEKMKRLHFTSGGTKKYRFTLEGEMGLNVLSTKTKTETSWILQVQNITDKGYVLDLVAYDIALKECDNGGFEELFHITRQFQKLYDELRVETDLEGNLVRVLNQKQLIEKWAQIKRETIQYFNEDMNLDDFFAISDEEFSQPEFLHKIVQEAEFFFLYLQLGGYGQKFNSLGTVELKRDNAFRTNVIHWDLEFSGRQEQRPNSAFGIMEIDGSFEPGKKWLQKSYEEMPFVKIEELKPEFSIKGKSLFYNDSGWLKEAELEVNEIVNPNTLYHKMKYRIEEIV
jgi:hypothetical protein